MSLNKLFPGNITAEMLETFDNADLNFHNYFVTIAWAGNNEACVLSTFQARLSSNPPVNWTPIAGNIASSNGEISFSLGRFSTGINIDFFWMISAVNTISAMAIFVVNADTKQSRKVSPQQGTKAFNRLNPWNDEKLKFTLF